MHVIKSRIQVDRFVKLLDRFIVAPGYQVIGPKIGSDDDRQWIELKSTFSFRDGAIKLTNGQQRPITKPMVRRRVIRIQSDRTLKFPDRAREIEMMNTQTESQRGVRFGQGIVDLQSLLRCRLRQRKRILRSRRAKPREKNVRITEAYISQRIARIFLDRLFEIID